MDRGAGVPWALRRLRVHRPPHRYANGRSRPFERASSASRIGSLHRETVLACASCHRPDCGQARTPTGISAADQRHIDAMVKGHLARGRACFCLQTIPEVGTLVQCTWCTAHACSLCKLRPHVLGHTRVAPSRPTPSLSGDTTAKSCATVRAAFLHSHMCT